MTDLRIDSKVYGVYRVLASKGKLGQCVKDNMKPMLTERMLTLQFPDGTQEVHCLNELEHVSRQEKEEFLTKYPNLIKNCL